MGGCCAPGTLGATTPAMEDNGSSSGETKGGGRGGGGGSTETTEGAVRAADQVLCLSEFVTVERREAAVNVEELLRVLEFAVENEYVDLRDRRNAGGEGNAGEYEYRQNAASSHCSSVESPTSVYSAAGSIFSRSSSYKERSPQQSSPGPGELCSSKKEKSSSTEHYGISKGRNWTRSDWADRVEATLKSMHHLQREDPFSELNSRHARPTVVDKKTHGSFDTLDPQSEQTQPSSSPRPTEVLTELDDYPRGSSDTNSEETERERKPVCNTSGISMVCPSHQIRTSSFISLGAVQCQLREEQVIQASYVREASTTRVDESYSAINQAREDSLNASQDLSSTCKTPKGGQLSTGASDSYANWLERHSKQLGWGKDTKYRTTKDLSKHETCTKDNRPITDGELKAPLSGFKTVQGYVAGSESNCTRSWTSHGDHGDFVLHTVNNVSTGDVHSNRGEVSPIGNEESMAEFGFNWSTAWRSRGMHDHVSEFFSFQPEEHVKGSFKFTPDVNLVENSYEALRPMEMPSPPCVVPENDSEPEQEWARPNLSEWTETKLGRSHEAFQNVTKGSPSPAASLGYLSNCGGAKGLRSPQVMLETPSSGSRCSKLNSRNGTPKSVFPGGGSLATNARHQVKVKVCVRMRPFHDIEKACPLRQLLCVMGKTVIVKEYDRPTVRQSIDNSETNALEFRVDHVVDDSYLQKHRIEKKEESQRRMYESIGLPCLEYALDGNNTTILAYGQVGTGKTHTMMGDGTEEGSGLMPRLAKELMHQLNTEFKGEFEVQVSYLEIYQERIRDLLAVQNLEPQGSRCGSVRSCTVTGWLDCSDESTYEDSVDCDTASSSSFSVGTPRSWRPERIPSVYFDSPKQKKEYLKVREHPVTGPYVEGLLWKDVTTWSDLETVLLQGAANRTFAAMPSNKFSSRGHTIFTIKLIRAQPNGFIVLEVCPAFVGDSSLDVILETYGRRRFVHGCPICSFSLINLVDLAGTEKPQCARKTPLDRQDESRYINRSLAQLNDVILNLSRNKKFVSYRGSALTWLLRDSLGGNAKLFLIANISPAEQDFQESVNTLRNASKANRIHSIITSHPDHKKQLLVSMKKEIQVLHDLVQDLTKNKLVECMDEEFRRARLPILSTFTVPRLEIPADRSVH